MKQVEFFVDDIRYVWMVSHCHCISFRLDDRNEKVRLLEGDEKPWEWDWDGHVQSMDLTGAARRPGRVFARAAELTIAWIATTRPGFFAFRANNPRKTRVYRVLIQRWLHRLSVPYGMTEHNDNFHFYRMDRQALAA